MAIVASLTKNRRTTLERIEKALSPDYFTDVNLFGRLYSTSVPVKQILHWQTSSAKRKIKTGKHYEHTNLNSVAQNETEEAVYNLEDSDEDEDGPEWKVELPDKSEFKPFKVGEPFGPTWSTHW